MNIQNLRYVLEIIEQGSISAAARKLYISQPYLSKILMEVEREYGITIFSREKNNLVLTERGGSFAMTIKEILDTINSFDNRLHHLHDNRYLAFSSCATAYTAEAYFDFIRANEKNPLRVHYREGDNNSVINDVYTRASEFGVIILNNEEIPSTNALFESMNLSCGKLFELKFFITARIGHPLSRMSRPIQAEDLYSYDFVLYPQNRSVEDSVVKTAQYEYNFDVIEWERIRHITYLQSRAQFYDLLQRTDTISFGFQPIRNQERMRNIVSLPVDPEFVRQIKKDADSTLYYICARGHKLSPLAAEYLNCLRAMDDGGADAVPY